MRLLQSLFLQVSHLLQEDPSFLAAAMRETHEELGVPPDRVEILGTVGPPEMNLRGNMEVWPFVVSKLYYLTIINDKC